MAKKYEVNPKTTKKQKTAEQKRWLSNPKDTPENPLTWEKLVEWMAWTGWIEGYVRKRISPMDAHLYEDYAQSCWIEILERPHDYLLEIYRHGKGKFTNYIKCIIDNQIKSGTSQVFKTNKRHYHTELMLSDEQWKALEEGNDNTHWTDTYPVKYNCPSGNRKKMVRMEYEDLPVYVENKESIVQCI